MDLFSTIIVLAFGGGILVVLWKYFNQEKEDVYDIHKENRKRVLQDLTLNPFQTMARKGPKGKRLFKVWGYQKYDVKDELGNIRTTIKTGAKIKFLGFYWRDIGFGFWYKKEIVNIPIHLIMRTVSYPVDVEVKNGNGLLEKVKEMRTEVVLNKEIILPFDAAIGRFSNDEYVVMSDYQGTAATISQIDYATVHKFHHDMFSGIGKGIQEYSRANPMWAHEFQAEVEKRKTEEQKKKALRESV